MLTLRPCIAWMAVFIGLAGGYGSAFSAEIVRVVIQKRPLPVSNPDTVTIEYSLMFGSELWRQHGRDRSDAGLADDIAECAGLNRPLQISIEVNSPRKSTFEQIQLAIRRLEVASQNAPADCKIEIAVFPAAKNASPSAGGTVSPGDTK